MLRAIKIAADVTGDKNSSRCISWDICCYLLLFLSPGTSAAIVIAWDICCYWYRLGHLLLLVSPGTSAVICCYFLLSMYDASSVIFIVYDICF
jgi:hypothetical protein